MTIDIHFKARRTALAVLGLTAASLVSPLARAQGTKVLKLGSILTVTGPNASIGKEGLAGVEYAIKQVNAGGGVRIGSDTYTVQLINIDDESRDGVHERQTISTSVHRDLGTTGNVGQRG